jgi:hypothetical protein
MPPGLDGNAYPVVTSARTILLGHRIDTGRMTDPTDTLEPVGSRAAAAQVGMTPPGDEEELG